MAYTVKFDNFQVSRQSTVYGNYAGYLGQLTTTSNWTTNTTHVGKYWRTAEGNLKAQVTLFITGTPTTSTNLYVNLPAGLVIDTARMSTNTSSNLVGDGKVLDTGTTIYKLSLRHQTDTSIGVLVLAVGGTYLQDANSYVRHDIPNTFINGDEISIYYEVPIVGWASPQLLSSEAETRVVAGWVGGSSMSVTSGAGATTVVYNTIVEDTHGDTYNTSTGAWTCKIPGWYHFDYKTVDGTITPASADRSIQLSLSVDGAGEYGIVQHPTLNTQLRGITIGSTFRLKLKAGQVVRVRAESSLGDTYTVLNNTGYSYLQWCMIQGPAQIAASEEVNAKRFSSSTAAVYNSATTVAWTNSDYDSHNGFGTSSVYTVKTPGKYQVTARVNLASVSASTVERIMYVLIRQNGTVKAYSPVDRAYSTTGREYSQLVMTTLNCIAGDTIDIQVFQNLVTSTNVNNNGGGMADNFVTIERIG